jgi:hypothetical protein
MTHEIDTELVIVSEENDREEDFGKVGATSISLNENLKGLIEDMIVEEINHNDKQSSFFEELLRIWFGENFTVRSISERKEHTVKFINCRQYVCSVFAQYLPDEESELYEAYFKLRKDGKYVRTGNVTIVREIKDYDMKAYAKYICNLNRKISSQYKILLENFELYLQRKVEEEILLEELKDASFADRIRIKSQRNTKVINYAPFMENITKKRKNRTKTTIDDFRKTITAMKKANVIYYVPIYVFYTKLY